MKNPLFRYYILLVLLVASGITLLASTEEKFIQNAMLEEYFSSSYQYVNNKKSVIPGGMILVLAITSGTNALPKEFSLQIIDDSGKVKLDVPFVLYSTRKAFALMPIPSTFAKGNYTLQTAYNNKQIKKIPKPNILSLQVIDRNYYQEYIALNKTLAQRKSSPASPQVIAEAKEIWDLTKIVQPTHLYELKNFIFPIKDYKYVTGMFADERVYTYLDGEEINGTSHGGIDIAATTGTPIQASADGVVVLAKDRIVTGKSVVIAHFPGVYTMYYHLHHILVKEGDIVPKGKMIGTVGSTGFSTGPHLHWEMRVHNIRTDPLLFLGELDKISTIEIQY